MTYQDIAATYFPGASPVLSDGERGWNNTTRYVETEGRRYVLRIYETHRDIDRIRHEHAVLQALNRAAALPFRVPAPVALPDGRGTVLPLADGSGRYACLFDYLDGVRPAASDPSTAVAMGEAAGQLLVALSAVHTGLSPAYPTYYELDQAHPSCPPARIAAFCAHPPAPFQGQRTALGRLAAALEDARRWTPRLRRLPHQLIHGDLNASNMLVYPDRPRETSAVLDFEFCTRDLRAMEPAVAAADWLRDPNEEDGAGERLTAFAASFSRYVPLTADERDAIPLLMRLRQLDVFVHFLGRCLDGVDEADALLQQIDASARGLSRLDAEAAPLARVWIAGRT